MILNMEKRRRIITRASCILKDVFSLDYERIVCRIV